MRRGNAQERDREEEKEREWQGGRVPGVGKEGEQDRANERRTLHACIRTYIH